MAELTEAIIKKAQAIKEWHPLADIFPMMSNDEFHNLCQSVESEGVLADDPIRTFDGKVLDGRNRICAMVACGKETEIEFRDMGDELTSDTVAGYVWSHNYHRRHLSPSQASMAVAKYRAVLADAGKDDTATDEESGVKRRTRQKAEAVLRRAPVEVVQAVLDGVVTVDDAEHQLDLSAAAQKKVLKSVLAGTDRTMAAARNTIERAKLPKTQQTKSEEEWLSSLQEPYAQSLEEIKRVSKRMEAVARDETLSIHLPWNRLRVDLESAHGALFHNQPVEVCCGPDPQPDCRFCKGLGALTKFNAENLTKSQRTEFAEHRAR